jgi:hypothetical protein
MWTSYLLVLLLHLAAEMGLGIRIKINISDAQENLYGQPENEVLEVNETYPGTAGSLAVLKVRSESAWTTREASRGRQTNITKWSVCGLHLAFMHGAYFITGFSKEAKAARRQKKQARPAETLRPCRDCPHYRTGTGSTHRQASFDAEADCEQHSSFFPKFRVGMQLLGYPEPFNEPPASDSLLFSWILPVASIDKRNKNRRVAQIGRAPYDDEDHCCRVHAATRRCFWIKTFHHCVLWLHYSSHDKDCHCSGKMMVDLCSYTVTMSEAKRSDVMLPADQQRMQNTNVQRELWKPATVQL